MRVCLVVSIVMLGCLGIVGSAAPAGAQSAPATTPAQPSAPTQSVAPARSAAPPATASPAPTQAAPAQAPAAAAPAPAGVAAQRPATPAAPVAPAQPQAATPVDGAAGSTQQAAATEPPAEGFDLAAALRGPGPALTADEAATRAAKTAPSVARAEAVARRAALAADQANIAVYPRLELEARYTLLSNVDPPEFATMLGPEAADSFAVQQHTGLFEARLSYPVSALFFQIIPQHKAAQKSAEAQRLQSRVEVQSVGLQAREAFYNYARARAALMVAKAAQNQAEARRKDVDALVNAGSLARVELMRADAQVSAAKVAVSRTAGSVAIARSALFTLTHYDGTDDVTISEDLEAELPELRDTNDAMLAKALANRTELKALRVSLEALEYNVDAAQGSELPQLVVGGSADYANPNQRYFGRPFEWNESWALFAAVTWSPNDWQANGSVAEQVRAEIATTLADLERLEDALKIEVTQAYEDYNAARASLDSSRAGIAAATESYRVRREQFRAGAAVATEVIDSEGELRTARLDLVNAVIDARISRARLDRAVEAQ